MLAFPPFLFRDEEMMCHGSCRMCLQTWNICKRKWPHTVDVDLILVHFPLRLHRKIQLIIKIISYSWTQPSIWKKMHLKKFMKTLGHIIYHVDPGGRLQDFDIALLLLLHSAFSSLWVRNQRKICTYRIRGKTFGKFGWINEMCAFLYIYSFITNLL